MSKTLPMDEDNDKGKENTLTAADHLEAILFQFVNLHERWSEDREVLVQHVIDLASYINALAEQVENVAALEERLREKIQTSIRNEVQKMASYVAGNIRLIAMEEIKPTVHDLKQAVREAGDTLSHYSSAFDFSHWKMLLITVLSSIAASVAIAALWLPKPQPQLPLSDQQLQAYETGKDFLAVWPHLSKEKQAWFLNVSKMKR